MQLAEAPHALRTLAGLGAIKPHEGLAVLQAAVGAHAAALAAPVITASPLVWATLRRLQPSPLFGERGQAPANQAAAPPSAPVEALLPGTAEEAPAIGAVPQLKADVEARVLAVVAGVLGASVDPQASLMEVRQAPAHTSAGAAYARTGSLPSLPPLPCSSPPLCARALFAVWPRLAGFGGAAQLAGLCIPGGAARHTGVRLPHCGCHLGAHLGPPASSVCSACCQAAPAGAGGAAGCSYSTPAPVRPPAQPSCQAAQRSGRGGGGC